MFITSSVLIGKPHCFAQKTARVTFKVYPTYSFFNINKQAAIYNDNWEGVNLRFESAFGYGAGIGYEKLLSERFAVFGDLRWNHWGGKVFADKNSPTFYLNLEVFYKSLNIPLGFSFNFLNKPKVKAKVSLGLGMDYSYHMSLHRSKYYGTSSADRNIDITTYYILSGLSSDFYIFNKHIVSLGLEMNNDYLFNPKRYMDFSGYFMQDQIPLKSTTILCFIGIKI